jgi:hypothetical protein
VFLLNSPQNQFIATFSLARVRHPFSRSYGVILPSSLTRVLSYTLGDYLLVYLSWIAVRSRLCWLEDFLGSMKSDASPCGSSSRLRVCEEWICLLFLLERLNRDYQNPAHPILLRPSIAHNAGRGTGILTCWPLSTPFGLNLGPTNPGRNNLPQETLDFR